MIKIFTILLCFDIILKEPSAMLEGGHLPTWN